MVTQKEIIEALHEVGGILLTSKYTVLANRIEAEGIAPPDSAGCSSHPKAPHGFNRNASHSSDEYVCDCAGFDPYDAGYQAGIHAAWESDGLLLPDKYELVPSEPTENQLFHGYKARAETRIDEVRSIYKAMLAVAPKGVGNEQ